MPCTGTLEHVRLLEKRELKDAEAQNLDGEFSVQKEEDELKQLEGNLLDDGADEELSEDLFKPISRYMNPNLRVALITKQLSTRTDLTQKQRRALQSRKNTAMFRERRRQNEQWNYLFEVELDQALSQVCCKRNVKISTFRAFGWFESLFIYPPEALVTLKN